MNNDMISLAERCEAATGEDRELERDIALALGWTEQEDAGLKERDPARYWWLDADGYTNNIPEYWTKSLDAAMTLVPEGWIFSLNPLFMLGKWRVDVWDPLAPIDDAEHRGKAKSPALALCAASLRARALSTVSRGESDG